MNKDEKKMTIEEMEKIINEHSRIIGDDEIVIKRSEYEELKKYRTDWLNDEKMHLQAELEDAEFELGCSNRLFQKVCEEKKELEKQLEQAKQETRDVLKGLKVVSYLLPTGLDCPAKRVRYAIITEDELEQLAKEHGIELED